MLKSPNWEQHSNLLSSIELSLVEIRLLENSNLHVKLFLGYIFKYYDPQAKANLITTSQKYKQFRLASRQGYFNSKS